MTSRAKKEEREGKRNTIQKKKKPNIKREKRERGKMNRTKDEQQKRNVVRLFLFFLTEKHFNFYGYKCPISRST